MNIITNRLFDEFFTNWDSAFFEGDHSYWRRNDRVRTKELKDSYEYYVPLPGIKKENIKATVKDGAVLLSVECAENTASYSFTLPDDVNVSKLSASHEDGLLTIKISNKKNENVTASILIWGALVLFPISLFLEQPWNLSPRLDSTLSLIYLGIFSTGIAWLLRFYILKHNGLVFQAQVAYLIPIFGVILGFLILNEAITSKVIISLIAVIIGIYIVKSSNVIKKNFKKI